MAVCSLGVGCNESGVCYAAAHNSPEMCGMIQKYEKKPVDRKVLCAREAMTEFFPPHADPEGVALRAIELWEEGFGK